MSPPREFPKPPFPKQSQSLPGSSKAMQPQPDYGEDSYKGANRLTDRKALITGADSGIGRAVALAFAREGADVVVRYLNEHEDAKETQRLADRGVRNSQLVAGDIYSAAHSRELVRKSVEAPGRVDVLVNNAAHQMTFDALEKIPDEEWDRTLATNLSAMFYITKAALPHMKPGASIINTASSNADVPNPSLLAYATTKGAIQNSTARLAQLLAEQGIRAIAVAPGPVWTPLLPASMPEDKAHTFGAQIPMKRPAQPCELAAVYVMLASDEASYVSGATVAVTGGKPLL